MCEVHVLIPAFNNQKGLDSTLDSLVGAKGDFCVVIVDDGSKPKMVVKSNYSFEIKILRLDDNQGIECALNAGLDYLASVNSTYIARLDVGDRVHEDRFPLQIHAIKTLGYDVVGSFIDVVDEEGGFLYQQTYPVDYESIKKGFNYQNQISHPAVMFRGEVLRTKRYPLNRKAAEDYALFYSLLKDFKFVNIPKSLIYYEYSDQSISSKKRRRQVFSRLLVQFYEGNFYSGHFYMGIFRTIFLLLAPRGLSLFLKKLLAKQERDE